MATIGINIKAVSQQARQDWISRNRKRAGLRERINNSVPFWLIIVAAVLFALSAPHTAEMFNQLTPGLGRLAPAGFEFGLLYAAFQRRRSHSTAKASAGFSIALLEALLFIVTIIANGAGSFVGVAKSAGLDTYSAEAILSGFRALPVTAQVGFLLVPLAAFIVPIGTAVAGEGLAALILEGKAEDSHLEREWSAVAAIETYKTALDFFIRQGDKANVARQKAAAAVNAYFADLKAPPKERESAAESAPDSTSDKVRESAPAANKYEQALKLARGLENPTGAALMGLGVSRTLAFDAAKQVRAERERTDSADSDNLTAE